MSKVLIDRKLRTHYKLHFKVTKGILQSDLEFARRLLDNGQTEQETMEALGRRGLDEIKVSQLVRSLRDGRLIVPEPFWMTGRMFVHRKDCPTVRRRRRKSATHEQTPTRRRLKDLLVVVFTLGLFECAIVYFFWKVTPDLGVPEQFFSGGTNTPSSTPYFFYGPSP